MASEMVMRVALAIWSERSEIPGGIPSEEYIRMARAAIEAMREPTAKMLGVEERRCTETHVWILKADKQVWQRMIEAALTE